ncbi:hypothetical protein HAX54_012053, partial [Datura stramonium]|nr:hypothetical protein [Datura stramonium]
MTITTRSGKVLGPRAKTVVDEHNDEVVTDSWVVVDEDEVKHKLVVANKLIVAKVNTEELDKPSIVARENECEKGKEKETPK